MIVNTHVNTPTPWTRVRRFKIGICITLFLSGSIAPLAGAATLHRPKDPVVLAGISLTPLIGADVGKIVGFRYVGGWQQIPIQIDERDVMDLAKPYNANATGVTVLQYCDPNTFAGADSNPQFDGNDELVFMAFDAGDKASGPDPAGVVATSGLEIRITDPIDGGVGYVYLFRTTGGLAPGAGQQYVNYNFNVIGKPNYRTSYDLGGANAEDTTVTTSAYALHFSEMWIHDGLQITTGGATGVNFLDRQRIALSPNSDYRNEDTFSRSRGCFIASRGGPIRALRTFMGSNSGVYNQWSQIFYARRMDQILNHRVHPMGTSGSAFDYNAQAIGMRYHSSVHPDGVTIDGVPDAISAVVPVWEMVTGNQGTLIHVRPPVVTDLPDLAISLSWDDQEPPSVRQNTGDAHTYGMHGNWMVGIANTDPTLPNYQPIYTLTARQIIYFDGPNKAVADAQAGQQTAMTDLSLAISSYTGGGTPPDAGTLQFSASSYTITEGNSGSSAATITVTRTGGSTGAVGVSYATANGTATAGSDYTATNGVLSWADGETAAKTFTVTVLGDTTLEPDETVNLTLSLPTGGANLGSPATAVLTILNDDTVGPAGSLQFSATNFVVTEGNSGTVNATITVTRAGGSSGAVGVSYLTQDNTAIAGSDYTAKFGSLSWASGDSASKTFTVTIQGDTTVEPDETVNLLLGQPTGGAVIGSPSTATLTIVNDDGPGAAGTLQFSSATYFHLEGDSGTSLATITVTRTGGSFGVVGVSFATSDGTATAGSDYTATNGTLNWANGETGAKTFTVPVLGDTEVEPDETVNLTLSSPTGGATLGTPTNATLTIVLDDAAPASGTLQFSAVSYSATEGNSGSSAATITVTRASGSSGAVGVSFSTSDGTATAGSDYTATNGVLSWADGDTAAKAFTVTVLGDTTVEGDETVNLALSSPTGGATLGTPATATLTIINDDVDYYAAWASAKGLTAANNAMDADPDGDGVANGLEFYLDGNPLAGDTPGLKGSLQGGNLRITYNRRGDAESLNVVLQTSPSLANGSWTTVQNGVGGVVVNVTENGSAPDDIEVLIPASGPRLYARLLLTLPAQAP